MKLNIGCGYDKKKGYVNLDKSAEVKPDKVCDIENGLPFADGTVTEIYSCHCLEHVRPDKWKFVLDEMARVSKSMALWELELPSDNVWSRTNIDHYRTFSFTSFSQYTLGSNRDYYSTWHLIDQTVYPKRFIRFFRVLFMNWDKTALKFRFQVVKE